MIDAFVTLEVLVAVPLQLTPRYVTNVAEPSAYNDTFMLETPLSATKQLLSARKAAPESNFAQSAPGS